MDKKDKLKCYTRKANDGHIYTTCDDKSVKPKKKKVKLVLKQPKEAATAKPKKMKVKLVLKQPKEAATDAMNAIKEVRNISGSVKLKKQFIERLKAEMEKSKYEKVLKATKEFEEKKEAAKPKPKPANYDMLRPEIRKNILEFAGNPKKLIEEKILVDINLRKDIKTRVINSVLEDMNKSLKELNINTTTPIYNADMRRKMKALGKGFAVGGSNSRDIYEILDDVESALGIDEYMRFLPKVEDRLEGVVKQRKQRQAREREEAAKIKKEQKAEADAEKAAMGDDDKREYYTAQSVRDYLKWDKELGKRVTEIAKSGLKNKNISDRYDNSLVKIKNKIINQFREEFFPRYPASYNEVKKRIEKIAYPELLVNEPKWNEPNGELRIYRLRGS
jgi:hypothetical protein